LWREQAEPYFPDLGPGLEALLEEAHIKLSSFVSDLLGASARRMLKAIAEGETDPSALATLGDKRLRATPAQLRHALGACAEFNPVYRRLIKLTLEHLQFVEQQIEQLDQGLCFGSHHGIDFRRTKRRGGGWLLRWLQSRQLPQ
jgi:hypothetical protein